MKTFIAILFSAVVISAIPQGWGPPPPPPPPSIDLELSAAVALTGEGSASAGQALNEQASGNAVLISVNGLSAGLEQEGEIGQIDSADLSGGSPATGTIQGVTGTNDASATDYLVASISADNLAAVENSASTAAQGSGTLAASASSLNNVNAKQYIKKFNYTLAVEMAKGGSSASRKF